MIQQSIYQNHNILKSRSDEKWELSYGPVGGFVVNCITMGCWLLDSGSLGEGILGGGGKGVDLGFHS